MTEMEERRGGRHEGKGKIQSRPAEHTIEEWKQGNSSRDEAPIKLTYTEQPALARGASAVQLHEELGLDPPTSLVLVGLARRQKRIDLIDEYHGRFSVGGDSKQGPDELLTLADPFGGE